MSGDSLSCSDLYATVDLSKKRQRNSATKYEPHKEVEADTAIYAVVDKTRKSHSSVNYMYIENDLPPAMPVRENQLSNFLRKCSPANFHPNEVVNTKCKINTAFILSLLACVAFGIFIVLITVIFVKINNLEITPKISSVDNSIESRLKHLEKGIQNINQTALNSSSEFNLTVFQKQYSEFFLKSLNCSNHTLCHLLQTTRDVSHLNTINNVINISLFSCAALRPLNLSSGYYNLLSSTGEVTRVYCDMDLTCGNITGGWMRVADLDLYNCPPGLRPQLVEGSNTCIRSEYREGCTPVFYDTFNISYSKVCGTITGYGVNTPDGFKNPRNLFQRTTNLNDNYVDGISVQSGANHVWTYVAGQCDCIARKPAFIGDDWTCDGRDCTSGNYCDGPLWDAPICGSSNPFFKELSTSTTADIIMRVCRDEDRGNEDIAIKDLKFYVQ